MEWVWRDSWQRVDGLAHRWRRRTLLWALQFTRLAALRRCIFLRTSTAEHQWNDGKHAPRLEDKERESGWNYTVNVRQYQEHGEGLWKFPLCLVFLLWTQFKIWQFAESSRCHGWDQERKQEPRRNRAELSIPERGLIHNLVTRWGLTSQMISRFLEQQQAVCGALSWDGHTRHLTPKDSDHCSGRSEPALTSPWFHITSTTRYFRTMSHRCKEERVPSENCVPSCSQSWRWNASAQPFSTSGHVLREHWKC